MPKRLALIALVLSTWLAQSGCSFLAPTTQLLTVTASDPEAEILVDGKSIGHGAGQVEVSRDEVHTAMARKGDRVGRTMIGYRRSTIGTVDFVSGWFWLVPFLGLLSPGAYRLSINNVTIVLPNVTVIPGK
jgi:hypothetical protein